MLLAYLKRPEKIAALIGIASAPDFTENLMWDKFNQEQKDILLKDGIYNLESEYDDRPYPVSKQLIEDGRKHLLLNSDLEINCPVRLIHGTNDEDVPAAISIQLAQKIMNG